MDQWRSKFSESFSLDRYWSIECSSLRNWGTSSTRDLKTRTVSTNSIDPGGSLQADSLKRLNPIWEYVRSKQAVASQRGVAQRPFLRKTREGWNCRFLKTSRTEGGDEVRAVWTQGSRQVGLSRCPKSWNL